MPNPIKVSMVDDDEWMREDLAQQISSSRQFVFLSSYGTAEEAVAKIPKEKPDVVLMDINLPKMSGIDCVRQIKAALPSVQVMMLTVYEDSEKIFQSLLAGASGYLLKRTSQAEILEAILQVYQGGSPINVNIARKVVQYFNQKGTQGQQFEDLSRREKQILERLAQGASYKEIADSLSVSIDTVRTHVKGVYSKLHVHSKSEAVAKYLRNK